jgi:ribosomal protein S18 acetylase RimI-like enzyme
MATAFASSLVVRRCDAASANAALELMVQAWPETERDAQLATLRATLELNGAAALLFSAESNGKTIGAVTGQIVPGKVASIVPPQIRMGTDGEAVAIARTLLERLSLELTARGVVLCQTLLAEGDVAAGARLRACGHEHAADLLYMAAEADSFPEQSLALPFELVAVNAADETRLAQLIDATYAGTLDCPRIDGLRDTTDVLTGYRAVGQSGDALWRIVRAGEIDAGCLLLAHHPQTRQLEIVYVGLIAAVRGRGWGLELTRHAQWLARQTGCERLVLAVDAANEPAIRIYATAGLRAWDRRAVWIKSLSETPNDLPATT